MSKEEHNRRLSKKIESEKKSFEKRRHKLFYETDLGENKEDFEEYLKLKMAKGAKYGTLCNRVDDLFNFLKWFPNKRIKDLTKNELLNFVNDLDQGKITYIPIRSKDKTPRPYTFESRQTNKTSIKTYLNTMLDPADYQKRVSWLEVKKNNPEGEETPYLTYDEVVKIIEHLSKKGTYADMQKTFIFAFMFEIGMRISELQAMYIKDISIELDGSLIAYIPKIKTYDRKVEISLFPQIIKEYLQYKQLQNKTGEDRLIDVTQKHIRDIVKETSVEVLGSKYKFMTPHKLRHSSATFFANPDSGLNYQDFVKRFGWTVTSSEAKRYFDKERVIKSKMSSALSSNEAMKYRHQIQQQEQLIRNLQIENQMAKQQMFDLRQEVRQILMGSIQANTTNIFDVKQYYDNKGNIINQTKVEAFDEEIIAQYKNNQDLINKWRAS